MTRSAGSEDACAIRGSRGLRGGEEGDVVLERELSYRDDRASLVGLVDHTGAADVTKRGETLG